MPKMAEPEALVTERGKRPNTLYKGVVSNRTPEQSRQCRGTL
jgi:hypothetical protein